MTAIATCPEVFTYIPNNLDLAELMPRKWLDYARWFVGGLYLRQHTEKHLASEDHRRVSSEAIKTVLPKRDYKTILNKLVKARVVQCDGSYQNGEGNGRGYSKGYRLAAAFREAPYQRVQLEHSRLLRKVVKLRQCESKRHAPVHRHLEKNLARLAITSDAPDELSTACIRHKDWRFIVCPYGRVHTNLTRLKSTLRPHLRIDGKPLWGIDIVNSQPLLLGITFQGQNEALAEEIVRYREWLKARDEAYFLPSLADFQHNFKAISPSLSSNSITNSSSPSAISICDLSCMPYVGTFGGDLSEYMRLCLEGGLYERLMTLTGYSRCDVKGAFFEMAYGRTWSGSHKLLARKFNDAFPRCWERICELKVGGYQELARLMQVVESYVVIQRTCTRIMNEHPTAPLLTIHDSLVTDEDHVPRFREILLQEFQRTFGLKPEVKAEKFESDHAKPVRSDVTFVWETKAKEAGHYYTEE